MSKYLEHLEFNGTDIILRDAEARGLIQENANEIASVKAKANLNEQKINALTPRMTAAEQDIVALDGRLDVAESDIDNLEVHMSAAEDDIDSLEDRVTSLEGTVDSLGDRMTAAEGDIDALEGRMDTAEGDIDNLEDAVDQHADLIDGLSNDVTALEGRMDVVETKNDAQDDKLDELDRKIAASTYEAGIGIYFGQGVDHTNINVEDELLDEIHTSTNKNIEQDTRLTNIENGTTKLPYGKSLSVTPDGDNKNLNLLDPNNNVLSSVQLPTSGGTTIHSPNVTPVEFQVTSGYSYTAWGDTCLNPTTIYVPSTGTTITSGSTMARVTETLDIGDIVVIDFSAIDTVIDSLSGVTQLNLIYENDWNGNTLLYNFDAQAIIEAGYIYAGVVTQSGPYMWLTATNIGQKYEDLYIGSGLYVDSNNNLTVNPITLTHFDTNDLDSDNQCYKLTDLSVAKAARLGVGSIVEIEGDDGGDSSVRVAVDINNILPGAPNYLNAQNSYTFLKVGANYWKLLRTHRKSSNIFYTNLDESNVKDFIMHMLDTAELLKLKPYGSNYPVPTLKPADSSGNVLTYEYWAYAENENRRIEVFLFSGIPNYDKLRVIVPRAFVPLAASGNNNDYSKYEDTLYPLYYDGTYYKTITTMPIVNNAIVVVYEKVAPVDYLGN